MKPLRDYYKILGVQKSASYDEIRSAYRRLAKKFHPDIHKSNDSELWMKLINEAYDVLGDKRKRALYDYVFFADSSFSSSGSESRDELSRIGKAHHRGFRSFFSRFIISIIRSEESLTLAFMALLVFGVFLFVVFGMALWAAELVAFVLLLAVIILMVRVIAELFSRAGIREEEAWFQDAFTAVYYLPDGASDSKPNVKKDI